MLGPIGSHLLASLKIMTPSEVERVTRSARSELVQKPSAVEEDAVSFDESTETKVVKLKSKKEQKESNQEKTYQEKEEEKKRAKNKSSKPLLEKETKGLDDSVIFIEEWAKSKDAKKKLFGHNAMKTYQHISSYEPIQVNAEDEDDIIISTGTSGILINKKQS